MQDIGTDLFLPSRLQQLLNVPGVSSRCGEFEAGMGWNVFVYRVC